MRSTYINKSVVNSVWSKMPNNIKSTKGVEEANNKTKLAAKEAKDAKKASLNNTKDIYKEYVESDYDGDDFIDDGFYDGFYDGDDL